MRHSFNRLRGRGEVGANKSAYINCVRDVGTYNEQQKSFRGNHHVNLIVKEVCGDDSSSMYLNSSLAPTITSGNHFDRDDPTVFERKINVSKNYRDQRKKELTKAPRSDNPVTKTNAPRSDNPVNKTNASDSNNDDQYQSYIEHQYQGFGGIRRKSRRRRRTRRTRRR